MARILLADDDAATRDFVQRALATDGHAVNSTQDGSEADSTTPNEAGLPTWTRRLPAYSIVVGMGATTRRPTPQRDVLW